MAIKLNGTTGVSGVDGSAYTPALQGADTNTGISFGTDTVTINTGGVARVTTNASGNVGIGTASPSHKLHVVGNAYVSLGNSFYCFSSDFGIGTPDSDQLQIFSGAGNGIRFGQRVSGTFTERMRIDSSGNLLVGTTSAGFTSTNYGVQLVPSGENRFIVNTGVTTVFAVNRNDDGSMFRFFRSGTQVGGISVNTTNTTYTTTSDYRLKEQVAPMTGALAKNELLNPVTYKWKSTGEDGQGFIAHELQAVFPDAVTGEKDAVDAEGKPVYQGVDTSFLVGHLVACVKELKQELDSVKAQLATLGGTNV